VTAPCEICNSACTADVDQRGHPLDRNLPAVNLTVCIIANEVLQLYFPAQMWTQRCASGSPAPTPRTFPTTCSACVRCAWPAWGCRFWLLGPAGARSAAMGPWLHGVAVAMSPAACTQCPRPASHWLPPACRSAGHRRPPKRLQAAAHAGAERQQRDAGQDAARVSEACVAMRCIVQVLAGCRLPAAGRLAHFGFVGALERRPQAGGARFWLRLLHNFAAS